MDNVKKMFKVLLSDRKKVVGLVALGVVGLGVIAGVFLVGEQKIFRPKADIEPITFKDASGNSLPVENGVPVTNSTNIKVELRAPAP
ncbi:MAG: hypothetical protein A2694_02420 [Candidatus Blackburnbacteria bacterium RIFCSPHIGHO2_01_FULL_40_17]|uniref:Polysaccharide chain length determinant N-terminal domain-containing protein n=1 Tax=Candidatus Blackburnbacteria bacterium RIFCSPLOWO2_01_FULL_40_20 TaxID=1797519 RepID=A0A1G1VEE8_9BACT|nr:MAG: hypothetical protein A2694_02420 [Candidatus Blackburnbacteria bacterium RIFCSPHIGHO2_01_FULL_40_17]OGY13741.1 MAG: hypothetical protein A3A77_01775 [Candidatus Blackburnbacteria bacterium RIFCSPLOWO2_01_FULL_40_20]OGY15156.1 MAG: hypothetical protein A3I52_00910 [Candidatus Blackburnbacteria bacterium RIFCSPLOWO2_02_FULL_40_10]HBL51687.1 hypothetical protein [Candidatus Blackburnbacteria bacterium]